MKTISHLVLLFTLALTAGASSLSERIKVDAMIVTKAELRRHMSAQASDQLRPSSYADLEASQGAAQPDYLVVRFLELVPGHYFGEAEARIADNSNGLKLNAMLHFNKGWVEYFIPLDGLIYGVRGKTGSPEVSITWNSLHAK